MRAVAIPAAAARTLSSRAKAWRVRWPLALSAGNSHGLLAAPGARDGEQLVDFRHAEHFGQRPAAARPFDRHGRIVDAAALEIEMLMELPHAGELARQARRLKARRAAMGEEGAHVLAPRLQRVEA